MGRRVHFGTIAGLGSPSRTGPLKPVPRAPNGNGLGSAWVNGGLPSVAVTNLAMEGEMDIHNGTPLYRKLHLRRPDGPRRATLLLRLSQCSGEAGT